jgi:hypothetical protein
MRLLKQNVYGELSPQEVLLKIEELARDRRPAKAAEPPAAEARPLPPGGARPTQPSPR